MAPILAGDRVVSHLSCVEATKDTTTAAGSVPLHSTVQVDPDDVPALIPLPQQRAGHRDERESLAQRTFHRVPAGDSAEQDQRQVQRGPELACPVEQVRLGERVLAQEMLARGPVRRQ